MTPPRKKNPTAIRNTVGLKRGGSKGRPAGVPNKLTTAAKSAIEAAAEGLGGAKRLQEWASSDPLNERAFWTQIYPKLLPLQVTGQDGAPLIEGPFTIVVQRLANSGNRT